MSDDKPVPRRRFFREGLANLLEPLGRSMAPLHRVADELGRLEETFAPPPPRRPTQHWLRPPGSLPEQQFVNQCSRCGDCVRACPAKCIKIDYSADRGEGAPFIDANEMSCVMCTGLDCMYACPSGALQQVMADYIDMGVAVWHEHICLRSSGENCTICVDTCPVGAKAITLDPDRINVREGCTGCGTCQHACPTQPKSITVLPKSAR